MGCGMFENDSQEYKQTKCMYMKLWCNLQYWNSTKLVKLKGPVLNRWEGKQRDHNKIKVAETKPKEHQAEITATVILNGLKKITKSIPYQQNQFHVYKSKWSNIKVRQTVDLAKD